MEQSINTQRSSSWEEIHEDCRNRLTRNSVLALVTLTFCQSMAVRIMSLPLNRLIESKYCQDYYRRHNSLIIHTGDRIPEDLCKVDTVQERLAVLQGIIETVHVLCGQESYLYLAKPFAYFIR